MKRTDPIRIGDLIERVMLESDNRDEILEQRAGYLWPEIVGQAINRYTFRRYVDNGVLHVYLSSAPLKNELSFHRSSLVKAINDALGREVIKEIQLH